MFFELYISSQFDQYANTDFMFGLTDTNKIDSNKSLQIFWYFATRLYGLPDIVHYFSKGIQTYKDLHKLFEIINSPPTTISSVSFPDKVLNYGLSEQLNKLDELRLSLGLIKSNPNITYIYDRFVYKSNVFMQLGFTFDKLKNWYIFCSDVKPKISSLVGNILEITEFYNLLNNPFEKKLFQFWKNIYKINTNKIIRPENILQEILPQLASETEKKMKDSYDILLYSLLTKIYKENEESKKSEGIKSDSVDKGIK